MAQTQRGKAQDKRKTAKKTLPKTKAHDVHQSRSERSQDMDERFRAKKVFTERMIGRGVDVDSWFNDPASHDIEGVDVNSRSIVRKKKRKVTKRKKKVKK